MGGNGQRDDLDSLFLQRFDLVTRCRAADPALGRFLVMYLARFLGEGGADILCVLDDVLDEPGERFAAYVGILLQPGGSRLASRRAELL
ncbi:hypothetical protein D3C83_08350 [compost metagenome]